MLLKELFAEFLIKLNKQIATLEKKNYPLTWARNIDWLEFYFHAMQLKNLFDTTDLSQTVSSYTLNRFRYFLKLRWDLIRKYPNNRFISSVFFLELATLLANASLKDSSPSRFQLLMPSITVNYNDITCTDLKDPALQLHHFILDDTQKHIIEVLYCLDFAEDDAILKHPLIFPNHKEPFIAHNSKRLSWHETNRLLNHTLLARKYYDAILIARKIKYDGLSIGAHINRLIFNLRLGGEHKFGAENNCSVHANLGIVAFSSFLEKLNDEHYDYLMTLPWNGYNNDGKGGATFGQIWKNLCRYTMPSRDPKKKLLGVPFCVEVISTQLEGIIASYPELYSMFNEGDLKPIEEYSQAIHNVDTQKTTLKTKMDNNNFIYATDLTYPQGLELLYSFLVFSIKNKNDIFLNIFAKALSKSAELADDLLPQIRNFTTNNYKQLHAINYFFYHYHTHRESLRKNNNSLFFNQATEKSPISTSEESYTPALLTSR